MEELVGARQRLVQRYCPPGTRRCQEQLRLFQVVDSGRREGELSPQPAPLAAQLGSYIALPCPCRALTGRGNEKPCHTFLTSPLAPSPAPRAQTHRGKPGRSRRSTGPVTGGASRGARPAGPPRAAEIKGTAAGTRIDALGWGSGRWASRRQPRLRSSLKALGQEGGQGRMLLGQLWSSSTSL